jgi:hypothetical protein
MRYGSLIAAIVVSLAAFTARAQEDGKAEKPAADRGPKLGESLVEKWKVGMSVSVTGGPVGRLTGTTTVPIEWPEQSIKIVSQDLSPGVRISYKSYGTAKQMVVIIPRVADGGEAHALLTMEITRHTLLAPDDTNLYVVPDEKKLPADFKQYLSPSPLIESRNTRIRAIAKDLGEGQTSAWPHVRAIYDWVRKTIKYKKNDDPKRRLATCVQAIDHGEGDCNQLTSTFVASCRASGIPARTVQIPEHCYAEFYLEDDRHEGHWFPAEASGSDVFGGILTTKPIMQKGDAFAVTAGGKTETYRLLPSNLTSPAARFVVGKPSLKLVCEAVKE